MGRHTLRHVQLLRTKLGRQHVLGSVKDGGGLTLAR
jgi:hypothetical protein